MILLNGFSSFKGDAKSLSPLALAFIGDGVFELLVRGHLLEQHTIPARKLHAKSVDFVNAKSQALAYEMVLTQLTEQEADILRRGRNANTSRILSKSVTPEEYHKATALEALFGYLYLNAELERVVELFDYILENLSSLKSGEVQNDNADK